MKRWLLSSLLLILSGSVILFASFNSNASLVDKKILLLTPKGIDFQQTIKGLKDDLSDDVHFIEVALDDDLGSKKITQHIDDIKPKMLVLLGNKPLRAYAQYQESASNKSFLPAVAFSALHIDKQLKNLQNTIGIRYEIPAVTSLVQLRSIVKTPVKKVGVIHRAWMRDLIQQNKKYCQLEDIELVNIEIPNNTSIRQISYQLKHLLRSDIDALWVVNDNALLQPRTLQNIWIPLLKRFNKPVVVGIKALTETSLAFGTFSVEADQYALGLQGAGIISEIIENNWRIDTNRIDPPVSIRNLLNLKLSNKKQIPIDSTKLGQMDNIIR